MRALPKVKPSEIKKRTLDSSSNLSSLSSSSISNSKKPKLQKNTLNSDPSTAQNSKLDALSSSNLHTLEAVSDDLANKLSKRENCVDLVLVSMGSLPDQIPDEFFKSYKPISDAGAPQQIKNLGNLLAMLLRDLGVLQLRKESAPLASTSSASQVLTIDDDDDDDDEDFDERTAAASSIKLKSEKIESLETHDQCTKMLVRTPSITNPKMPLSKIQPNLQPKSTTNKMFKLNDVTMNSAAQFSSESLGELLFKTHKRILSADGKLL
jgi:hypothetical protein